MLASSHIEIAGNRLHQRLHPVLEEMVRTWNGLLIDHDALLGLQFLDQRRDILGWRDDILLAMDDEARRWAGRQKREIVTVRLRCDRDEAFHLGPAHQQLHSDPGAKGKPGHPTGPCLRVDGLRPVECRRSVRQFAGAVVERALAAADAAKIETQHRKTPRHESIVDLIDDRMVHAATKLGVRMQDHRYRGIFLLRRVIAAFETAGRTGKNDFRHRNPWQIGRPRAGSVRSLTTRQQAHRTAVQKVASEHRRVLA